MLSTITRSTFINVARRMTVRSASAEAASTSASTVKLNFTLPHEKIYVNASVHSVIIPGSAGEYGVTANHVPYVAELKPGVLQILHEENSSEPEKYFVPGGFALTHPDSSTVRWASVQTSMNCAFTRISRVVLYFLQDVVCPEAVKLDDIDAAAVSKQFEAAKSAFASASSGSVEQAEAQIDMEVNKAMGVAIGLSLS
jgi:F-type H+-transporting ATPase subunit delta